MDAQQLSLLGLTSLGSAVSTDASGHGSHLTGIMLNTQRTSGRPLLRHRAGRESRVGARVRRAGTRQLFVRDSRHRLGGAEQDRAIGIRVLNLSLGAAPQSRYWDDPLNRAVMKAWQAGIVVVASAGNTGPARADHHRSGQRAVRDHRWCDDGQLHAGESGGRSPRLLLRRGPDARRLREARSRRAGRAHLVADADVREASRRRIRRTRTAATTSRCPARRRPRPSRVARLRCCCRRSPASRRIR